MYQSTDPLFQQELSEPQKQADDQALAYRAMFPVVIAGKPVINKRRQNFEYFIWLATMEKSGKIAPDDNKIISDYTNRYILNYGNN